MEQNYWIAGELNNKDAGAMITMVCEEHLGLSFEEVEKKYPKVSARGLASASKGSGTAVATLGKLVREAGLTGKLIVGTESVEVSANGKKI